MVDNSDQKEFGGLDLETAKLMGLGRARAVAAGRRNLKGASKPGDEKIVSDDFRCDAEQVTIDKTGKIRKS